MYYILGHLLQSRRSRIAQKHDRHFMHVIFGVAIKPSFVKLNGEIWTYLTVDTKIDGSTCHSRNVHQL